MNDLWNEICYNLKSCIDCNVAEKVFEDKFVNGLSRLGWLEYKQEIVRQCSIKVGHETKLADIVLKKDGTEQLVVEMKRPSHVLTKDDVLQLSSYMRVKKVCFGLLVGKDMNLYYDLPDSTEDIKLVKSFKFKNDNKDGIELISLLEKEKFSRENLRLYCEKALKENAESQELRNELDRIGSDEWRERVLIFIGEELINKGYGEDAVYDALENIEVQLSLKKSEESVSQHRILPKVFQEKIQNRKGRDNTQYIFNHNKYGKGKLVLAVIQYFVTSSSKTYNEWQEFFTPANSCPMPIIKRHAEIVDEKRYFVKQDEILSSSDGIKFAVCTQWGIKNIGGFIQWAKKQGLVIEEL